MQVGEFHHFSFLIWRYELYQYELYPKASWTLVRHPMQLKRDLLLQSFDHFLHIDNLRTQDFQIFLTQLSNYLTHDFNSLFAPTKLVPLSDRITCTFPRFDMNLRRVNINASVDKFLADSKWTALVVRHVNSTPYFFAVPEFDLAFLFILTWTKESKNLYWC